MKIKPINKLRGKISVPGDKSISHRSIILGSIAEGTTEITGFLMGEDCLSTVRCFCQLGIDIDITTKRILVHGKGLRGLSTPQSILDVGNSGTTIRLLSGLLSGQSFSSILTGDASIKKRPMKRVTIPLREMNADIDGKDGGMYCPLITNPSTLYGITYHSPVASAQVKSSILLAGLYAKGTTCVVEPSLSRNHTELMLKAFGTNIQIDNKTVSLVPPTKLYGNKIHVPGDISSAAFFIVATLITPNSELLIENVGLNPTRTGILTILSRMRADIQILNRKNVCGEDMGDILIHSSSLKATTIDGHIIPKLIDEIPILAVAACYAEGTTIIKDAQELKHKESNRITAMVNELSKLGANIKETNDGMVIEGGRTLHGNHVESYHDHRVAMSLAVAGLGASSTTVIHNSECVNISFPHFFETFSQLCVNQ